MFLSLIILLVSMFANFQADQPEFKGGKRNLNAFIINNMIYPEYSKINCLQGTVNISFHLNREGRVFRSEVQKGFGTDLDDEALRIVRLSSGKWIVPSGYDTTTAIVLPVNFALKDFNCEQREKDELNAALRAYTAREDLTKAIYNFYDKKSRGEINENEEAGVIALKTQLGYDQKFISRLYKRGLRKFKQGDQQGGCEDLNKVRLLGSDMADKSISERCR